MRGSLYRGYSPSNTYRESNRLDDAWQVLHWELRTCHFYQAQKHSIFWMKVRFLNAVCISIDICKKKLDSMRFFLCKEPISYYLVKDIPVKAALAD